MITSFSLDRCNWAEFDISRGYYQGQVSLTKKVYCEAANHFLTAVSFNSFIYLLLMIILFIL